MDDKHSDKNEQSVLVVNGKEAPLKTEEEKKGWAWGGSGGTAQTVRIWRNHRYRMQPESHRLDGGTKIQNSSTRRDDAANGACEAIYVTNIERKDKANAT